MLHRLQNIISQSEVVFLYQFIPQALNHSNPQHRMTHKSVQLSKLPLKDYQIAVLFTTSLYSDTSAKSFRKFCMPRLAIQNNFTKSMPRLQAKILAHLLENFRPSSPQKVLWNDLNHQ